MDRSQALFSNHRFGNTNTPLTLDMPALGFFHEEEQEDIDMGSVYYPASLFYKLYAKKEKLGEGSSGITYKYIRRESKHPFAVKIIRAREDSEIFQQIKEEFIHTRILCHPNIIKAQELYFDKLRGRIYYVMSYFPGESLQSHLERNESNITGIIYY